MKKDYDWLFPVGFVSGIVLVLMIFRITTGESVLKGLWQLLTQSPK